MGIRYLDEKAQKEMPSAGRTALEQGLQGATFGFSDEAMDRLGAGIASIFTGESYGDLLKEARGMSQERMAEQMEQRPVLSMASGLTGALLTGGALAAPKAITGQIATTGSRGALNAVPEIGKRLVSGLRSGTAGQTALKGAAAGATSGALYGAGGSREGERVGGALSGGIVGGGLSILAPVAIGSIKKGYDGIANEITKRLATRAGEVLPVEKPIQKVVARLRADFPDNKEFVRQLNRYASSQGKSLVELGGESTKNLAEGASLFPQAQKSAVDFFDAKISMAPEQIKKIINKTVSPSVNYLDTLDDVVRVGQAKAAPLYNKAFKSNQSVESPLINRILRTPEGVRAFSEARKNIQNEMSLVAKPSRELTEIANELASINLMEAQRGGVAKGLKLKTLDYVKRAMDSSIKTAIRQGDDGEIRRLSSLKSALVNELDSLDKTGAYAKARSVAGDYLQSKEAMDAGLNFLRVDPQMLERVYGGLSQSQRTAYKVGVVKSINDAIDNTFDGRNVTRIFGKKSTRDKLQTILTPNQYNAVKAQVESVDAIYKLRNQLTGNSRTAIRQLAAEEFAGEGVEMMASVATRGVRSVATDKFISVISRQMSGLNQKVAADVAEILYETDPKAKAKIIRQLFSEYNSTSGIRQTQAAQKLEAFYAISDILQKTKEAAQMASPAIGAASGSYIGGQE